MGNFTKDDEGPYREEVHGVDLAEDLTWTLNTSLIVRKAQQHLQFLRRLRRVNQPQQLLCNFYRSTVESILTSCITVWYGSPTSVEHKVLQRVVKTAQHITVSTLPPIQDIYDKRCLRKAANISSDPTHPSHPLFQPLPSRKRLTLALSPAFLITAHLLSNTRGNTLDHVYTNIKDAFSTTPLPLFSKSDHISLLMKPTYRQLLKRHKYSSQIGAHFNTNSDPRRMWQEIQVITDYKSKVSTPVTTDVALPAEPNNFYAHFETPAQAQSSNTALFHTMEEEPPLILAADKVRKAAGPDGIPGQSLKAFASQLAHTFTDIFNLFLAQSTVPV
ncbi:hypothetical protein NFI96_008269 [Prochilodus magdalenae]|nr:hypothetical protein NFI96_008269 [Prochilodus magdalenae]